ncbi:uncharacterized protein LOC132706254 [Cylas formicarius]|uniref:uncharacterized protein LOC132706254 n=1 Tax=Cylas formicarius TaxID=197179 RepID=UPI002958AE4D|nr:uncharacterized protein LOC132706254 [Cylas formicarius]
MSDYYKSLISDEEVIAALIKESRRREGFLSTENTRLKPNLNFFQRTVTNLVSSNTRINKTQDSLKLRLQSDKKNLKKSFVESDKREIDHVFERVEFLKRKIHFVQSSEDISARANVVTEVSLNKSTQCSVHERLKQSDKQDNISDCFKKSFSSAKSIPKPTNNLFDGDVIYISSEDSSVEVVPTTVDRKSKRKKRCKLKQHKKD